METSQVLTIIISIVVSTVTLLGGLTVILHRATNKRIDDVNKRIDDLRDIVLTIMNHLLPPQHEKRKREAKFSPTAQVLTLTAPLAKSNKI